MMKVYHCSSSALTSSPIHLRNQREWCTSSHDGYFLRHWIYCGISDYRSSGNYHCYGSRQTRDIKQSAESHSQTVFMESRKPTPLSKNFNAIHASGLAPYGWIAGHSQWQHSLTVHGAHSSVTLAKIWRVRLGNFTPWTDELKRRSKVTKEIVLRRARDQKCYWWPNWQLIYRATWT